MLDALRFVQGSVAKKDLLPALTHFVIENGTVRGYDGTLALCAPINLDIACKPKGETMVKAIQNCKDTITMTMTPAGRLRVQSGSFRVLVDCLPDAETPHTLPDGEHYPIDNPQGFYDACVKLEPFIGNDASRPWSCGLLIDGPQMFATNNVVLANVWTGLKFPHRVCVPAKAIREIVRVKQVPTHVQIANTAIAFHYADGRWIRTQLLDSQAWPDLGRVLDKQPNQPAVQMDERIFDALETIKPFADKLNRVWFDAGRLTTSLSEEGAEINFPDLQYVGVYGLDMLLLLKGVAKSVDWSAYPKPCLWFGDKIRGAIIGQRG